MLFVGLAVVTPTSAQAQTRAWSDFSGAGCVAEGPLGEVATIQGFQCLIANVLSIALSLIGLAGFVMLLYGSFMYLTSGGNSKGMESARSTITFAIVGLVVALCAFIVVNLVAAFTGVDVIKTFVIPGSNSGF